jgi:general secretion pathway protein G
VIEVNDLRQKALKLLARRGRANAPKGMTLLEIMIVIAILGLIASVVVVAVMNNFERAKANTAKLKIGEIHKALDLYKIEVGDYPSQSEGLRALTSPPNGPPYMKDTPKDPWSQEFVYFNPARNGGNGIEIISKGADKQEGTDDDIKKE